MADMHFDTPPVRQLQTGDCPSELATYTDPSIRDQVVMSSYQTSKKATLI